MSKNASCCWLGYLSFCEIGPEKFSFFNKDCSYSIYEREYVFDSAIVTSFGFDTSTTTNNPVSLFEEKMIESGL